MADEKAKIVLDGDVSPLRQKLRQAGEDLKKFGKDGETAVGGITGPLGSLQAKFVALGAILAGGAVFREAVAQSIQLTEESTKLARAMATSAGEASILRETLTAGNTSQEEFVGAAQKLAKQVRENEAGLNAMGLKTRDAAGQLRPLTDLMLDGIGVVNGYRAGTDRAIAGQTMFGKGFEMTSNLALMNKEAIAKVAEQMKALGLVTTNESVAAWEAYDDAADSAGLTLLGLKNAIGQALLPALTTLGNWFSDVGPAAVVALKGAIGGLVSVFWGLKNAVTITFELINAAVVQVAEPLRALAVGMAKALGGDFEGAKAEFMNIPKVWDDAWAKAFDNIAASAEDTRNKLYNLIGDGTPTTAPDTGGKSAASLVKSGKGAGKSPGKAATATDSGQMATYEAALAARKNFYESENALREFSKAQELAYWRDIQASAVLNSKDATAIAKRTATLEVEIRRQEAKELRDLTQVEVDSRKAAALAQIQGAEQNAQFARDNNEITQAQLIALEEGFARRRFEIEYQSLLERQTLALSDPGSSPAALAQIKEQMLEVERNYQMRRGQLGREKKQAGGESGLFDGIGSSFAGAAQTILTKATTLRAQLASIFQGIYLSFITALVTKPLGEYIAAQAMMLAVKLGFLSKEKAADVGGAGATVIAKTAEAVAVVNANATEAATGAAASQAMIPVVGPELALKAMAATYSAVSGFGLAALLPSAAKGYDIPKGLNPITQLHEQEMVLPKPQANVIRNLAEQEGQGTGGTTIHNHWHVSAMDSSSFKQFMMANYPAVAASLRLAARNGSPR